MADFAENFDDAENAAIAATAELRRNTVLTLCFGTSGRIVFSMSSSTGKKTRSVRPNQIFAVSLKNAILRRGTMRKVVEKVENEF
jgi:predicted short-subunit dehydrogenase-like oxidoreductase (DUF2520 family)